LATEGPEGREHDARRPAGNRVVFMAAIGPKNRLAGVRGSIVALKPGNAGGVKGPRKMEA